MKIKFYQTAIIGVVLMFFVQVGTGCKGTITDYDREKVRLDSLNEILTATALALNVDEKELQLRVATVNTWYVSLQDTAFDVAQKMQVEFNGFKVVYQNYIDLFFSYSSMLKLHREQYAHLEERVKKQELTRDEFKTEFYRLKAEAETNFRNANLIAKPVYDLELSWRRYKTVMADMQKRNKR